MLGVLRRGVYGLAVLLLAAPADAEDTSAVASRVIRAFRAGDAGELGKLAGNDLNDPWLVVDAVLQQGERDAAHALIANMPNKERRAYLRSYAESEGSSRVSAHARDALRRARTKRLRNNPTASVAILEGLVHPRRSVFRVVCWHEKAMALRDLDRDAESARAYVAGAKVAHSIGWRTRRNRLLRYVSYATGAKFGTNWPTSLYLKTARTYDVGPSVALVIYSQIEGDVIAITVTPERTDFVPLGEFLRLRRACNALRGIKPDTAVLASEVGELLVVPLRLPKSTKRLLIVPQTRVEDVPFALVAPKLETSCLPLMWSLGGDLAQGNGVVVVYDSVATTGGPRGPRWKEAQAVGSVLIGGSHGTRHQFEAAVEKRERWRAIHFACPFDTESKSIVLGPGQDDRLRVNDLIAMRLKADLLVFSGGLTVGMGLSAGDGGLKYPDEEVGGERWLEQAEKTLEELRKRMATFDLGTRFLVGADAPRAIVCLWNIDHDATRVFMAKFYELWNPKDGKKGLPTATALRRAQAFVASHDEWKHPFYWAGWQLWGRPD